MCEGFSLDDVLALDAAHIAEYGFINIGVDVEPPATRGPIRSGCSTRPATPS